MSEIDTSLTEKRDRLLELLRSYGSCVVTFSGGVDSAVLANAAHLALAERAIAVTAFSPSLPEGELQQARIVAERIGIQHETVFTDEFNVEGYVKNAPDRCFHCKTELYTKVEEWAREHDFSVVLNGANLDDMGDYRPGMNAARRHNVKSPLIECGFQKYEIRQLARDWNLPVWDKPAAPCLSSRVAYGEQVTPERLAMIDRAEQFLRERGMINVRVRYHRGDMARIEVPGAHISELAEPQLRAELNIQFKAIGFKYITLDLEGFRSGSLNAVLNGDILSEDQLVMPE